MLYRPFANTNKRISALGMGCMRFENPDDIDAMAAVVLRAFGKGVNYIDTAPFYCKDKSETIVGTAVREMKKTGREFYISTKTSAPTADRARADLERSLTRLQVDAIDFYHIWCLKQSDHFSQRKKGGALDAIIRAKEEGLIRHICVSAHLTHDALIEMLDESDGLFEGILLGLNAANYNMRIAGARAAHQRSMAVMTMNTLGGGLLTACPKHFDFLKQNKNDTILDAALRFNLSLPEITTALVGFRNCADVDSAVQAVERFQPLTPEQIKAHEALTASAQKNFCTQCGYCLPACPEGIPIVRLMENYNRHLIENLSPQETLKRLNFHWGIPNVKEALAPCTRCRQCETACTQHLDILNGFDNLLTMQKEIDDRKKKMPGK